MRFKAVTLQRLDQVDALVKRLEFQINRQINYQEMSNTVEALKNQIEELRGLISIEHDNFEQQFR